MTETLAQPLVLDESDPIVDKFIQIIRATDSPELFEGMNLTNPTHCRIINAVHRLKVLAGEIHSCPTPCCPSCGGSGGDASGPCWDCQGTGHSHSTEDGS